MENKAVDAEIVKDSVLEVVQTSIVPAKKTGQKLVLFGEENRAQLIQAFVNSEIVHFTHNAADSKKLAKKYGKLTVKDKDDKAGYEKVKEAYNELVKIRTTTEKDRKKLNDPYTAITKGINEHGLVNITGVLAETEKALKVQKDTYEKWEQEEKDRLALELKQKTDKRINELKEAGLTFDGELYVIGETISMDATSIGKQSDVDYNFFLEKVKTEKKKIDDAAEALAAKEAQEKQDAADLKEKLEQQAKDLRDEKVEAREDKLTEIGLIQDSEAEYFGYESLGTQIKLTYDDVAEMDKSKFNEWLESTKQIIIDDRQRIADLATPKTGELVPETETTQEVPVSNGAARPSQYLGSGTMGGGGFGRIQKPLIEVDKETIKNYLDYLEAAEVPELHSPKATDAFNNFEKKLVEAKTALLAELEK